MHPRSRPTIEEVEDDEHWSVNEVIELDDDDPRAATITVTTRADSLAIESLGDSESDWVDEDEEGEAMLEGRSGMSDDEWVDEDDEDIPGFVLPPSSEAYPSPHRSSPTSPQLQAPFQTLSSPSAHSSALPSSPTPGARGDTAPHAPAPAPSATNSRATLEELLAEEGMLYTSPIKGTPRAKARKRQEKAQRQRVSSTQKRQQERQQLSALERRRKCKSILKHIEDSGLEFVDIMNFVFDPASKQGSTRYQGFFSKRGSASQILDWWASSKNSKTARAEVHEWAVGHVVGVVAKEARRITEGGKLQAKKVPITTDLVSSFKLEEYSKDLATEWAPVAMRIISAFSTSRHAKTHSTKRKEKTNIVCTRFAGFIVVLSLL